MDIKIQHFQYKYFSKIKEMMCIISAIFKAAFVLTYKALLRTGYQHVLVELSWVPQ